MWTQTPHDAKYWQVGKLESELWYSVTTDNGFNMTQF
jgi:hypothetical protein